MKNALILTTGSRGDTEPFFALAQHMVDTDAFDIVHICLHAAYSPLLPSNSRIRAHLLSYDIDSFRPAVNVGIQSAMDHHITDKTQLIFSGLVALMRIKCVPELEQFLTVARESNPTIVIGTMLTIPCMYTIGEILSIPTCIVHFQPNVPSRLFPQLLSGMHNTALIASIAARGCQTPERNAQGDLFLNSYWEAYDAFFNGYAETFNNIRRKLSLSPLEAHDLHNLFAGNTSSGMIINAFPKSLCPLPDDVGKNVWQVQPFADAYIPKGWEAEEACPGIIRFLSHGDRPVCVTFGSMNAQQDREKNIAIEIFDVLCQMDIDRVLVLGSSTAMEITEAEVQLQSWVAEHVYFATESVQYAWLFPQCKAVICHGGAGTVFASLRSATPLVIIPVMVDQFLWSDLIDRLEMGVKVTSDDSDFSEKLREGLGKTLGTCVSTKVSQFAELCADSGTREATELLCKFIEENSSRTSEE